MPSVVFAGSKVKTLKDTMTLNGKSDIISSTVDPTASAVDAPIGSLLINQTSGKLYRKLDAGSSVNWEEVGAGVGGINYILNPSAEVNTTGWATYADAAGTAPVDGTGGSPNVTWTRSTTSPLRGVADFNFVKDAANRQGQGVSYDFTIDEADKAKVLSVTFDYEVLSGTYADGDLTVYLIADPTGTPVVIQPAGYTVQSATVGTTMRQIATFQTQATGTSYRLCFHVASTSASAYTLAIDNVVVGPQQTIQGAAISDWQDLSGVTVSGFTATSILAKYRRVGDSAEINIRVLVGGAITTASITLPNTLPIDENKLNTNTQFLFASVVGYNASTAAGYVGGIYQTATNSQTFTITGPNQTAWGGSVPFGEAWASGDSIAINAILPIAGWSSNTVMSSDTDTRVVAGVVRRITSSFAVGTAATKVQFNESVLDTHSAWDSTNFRWVIPVSGVYQFSGAIGLALAASFTQYNIILYRNGSAFRARPGLGSASVDPGGSYSFIVSAVAGDYFEIFISTNGAASAVLSSATMSGGSNFQMHRLSGPATIAASETVALSATRTAGNYAVNNNVITYVWNSASVDTHAALNTSSGVYTVPVSGIYEITASLVVASSAVQLHNVVIRIGSTDRANAFLVQDGTSPNYRTAVCNFIGSLVSGQAISIRASSNGSATWIGDSSTVARLSIKRIGN